WVGLTGSGVPKKAGSSSRSRQPKPTVPIEEYAQKINELKERANTHGVSREEVEQSLRDLNLAKLGAKDLVAIARQLNCDVNAKTTKAQAIDAIERLVLDVKETLVGGIS